VSGRLARRVCFRRRRKAPFSKAATMILGIGTDLLDVARWRRS